jgi:hypothetical protein
MTRTRLDWRLCVRFISALALVVVAFAHRPLDVGGIPDASAYAFPDGSVPVICVTLPGESKGNSVDHGLPCGACLVSASVLLPVPTDIAGGRLRPAERIVFAAAEPSLERPAFPPSAPPQAPPAA